MNNDEQKISVFLEYLDEYVIELINKVLINDLNDPHTSATLVENLVISLKILSPYCNQKSSFNNVHSYMLEKGFTQEQIDILETFKNIEQHNFENPHNFKFFKEPYSEALFKEVVEYSVKHIEHFIFDLCNIIITESKHKWKYSTKYIVNLIMCVADISEKFGVNVGFKDIDTYFERSVWFTKCDKKKFYKFLKAETK